MTWLRENAVGFVGIGIYVLALYVLPADTVDALTCGLAAQAVWMRSSDA